MSTLKIFPKINREKKNCDVEIGVWGVFLFQKIYTLEGLVLT